MSIPSDSANALVTSSSVQKKVEKEQDKHKKTNTEPTPSSPLIVPLFVNSQWTQYAKDRGIGLESSDGDSNLKDRGNQATPRPV